MKRKHRKQRWALTLLSGLVFFLIQTVTLVIAIGLFAALIYTNIIPSFEPENISAGNLLLFIGLLSIIMGAIINTFSGKIYMQPFNRLLDQLNRLAAGDFKARIHFGKLLSTHPSFQEVEASFNAAAAALEQTEALRSDFINNFSHEFKTPIVSIAGFAKLLRRGNLPPEQQEEYLAVIEEEALRLSRMATTLLDLTRVENQTILTNVTRFNLSEQLRSAILLLADKWEKMSLDFNIRIGECHIEANEELLRHVSINLIDNAIKFSDPGSTVDVALEETAETVTLTVSNTGKPIPEACTGRIFQKFYQADESHSAEGSGIGLAIVKKAVELHRGTVWAESSGARTTFTVVLPKKHN